jgi:hypothetical protein
MKCAQIGARSLMMRSSSAGALWDAAACAPGLAAFFSEADGDFGPDTATTVDPDRPVSVSRFSLFRSARISAAP